MVGITARMKAKEDISSSGIYKSTPCILSSALNLCLDVSTSVPPLISCVSHEHLERSTAVQMFLFYFCAFFPSRSLFLGRCHSKDSAEEIITRKLVTFFWKHDLAKQLHHVACTQYKTQHGGVLAAQFAISVKTVSRDLLQDRYK